MPEHGHQKLWRNLKENFAPRTFKIGQSGHTGLELSKIEIYAKIPGKPHRKIDFLRIFVPMF